MLDTYGSIQHLALAAYLWLIPGLPFAAAIVIAALGLADARRRAEQPKAPPLDVARLAQIASGAAFASLGVAVVYTFQLVGRPRGVRFLLDHVARFVRLGQLEASFDLAMDPLAATMCVTACGLGVVALLFAGAHMTREPPAGGAFRAFAWMSFLLSSVLLLALADNVLLFAFGWQGVALAVWGLVSHRTQDEGAARAASSALVIDALGTGALLVASALLFWGLGGAWSEGDYAPDMNPRFAANAQSFEGLFDPKAEIDDEDDPGAKSLPNGALIRDKSSLTLASFPGAVVYVDESRTPLMRRGEPAVAPFTRVPVDVGRHSFRIHPGQGQDDHLLSNVLMPSQGEMSLIVVGGSVSFREIHDQLVLHSPKGETFLRDALVAKHAFARIGVVTLAGVLLLFAAIVRGAQLPFSGSMGRSTSAPGPARALVQALAASSGAYLLARVAIVVSLTPAASTVAACVGAITALAAAWIASAQSDLRKVLAYATVAHVGLMILGTGAGAHLAAAFHLVTHAAFMGCLVLASSMLLHRKRRDDESHDAAYAMARLGGLAKRLPGTARAYRIACMAATIAPIPGLSGFWSTNGILVGTVSSQSIVVVPPVVVLGVAVVAAGLVSFALWRSYFLVFEGPEAAPEKVKTKAKASEKSTEVGSMVDLLRFLAAVAALVGPVVAIGGRMSGGPSLIDAWLTPSFDGCAFLPAESGLPTEVGVGVLVAAFALAGWSVARSTYGRTRAKDWETHEPERRWYASLAGAIGMEAMLDGAVSSASRFSGFIAEIDRLVIDGVVHAGGALLRAAVPGRADTGEDRPASEGRTQTVACAIVAALLAVAVVLYLVSNG